jgi:hypothetical protein
LPPRRVPSLTSFLKEDAPRTAVVVRLSLPAAVSGWRLTTYFEFLIIFFVS